MKIINEIQKILETKLVTTIRYKKKMSKFRFDPNNDGLETVRAIVFDRLKKDNSWNSINIGFENYVEFIGPHNGGKRFLLLTLEVVWELIVQGVISPGLDGSNLNLPFFHITDYGRKVLAEEKYLPHDPNGYLELFHKEITNPDSIVESYLTESLNCFERGNLIASIVMLGVASERAFLLLCESFYKAIKNPSEKTNFKKIRSYAVECCKQQKGFFK